MNKLIWIFLTAAIVTTPVRATENGAAPEGAAALTPQPGTLGTLDPANPHAAEVRRLAEEMQHQLRQIVVHRSLFPWDLAGMAILNIRYYVTARRYESAVASCEAWAAKNPRGPIRPGGPGRPANPIRPVLPRGEIAGRVVVESDGRASPQGTLPILRVLPFTVRVAGRHVVRSRDELQQIAHMSLRPGGQPLPDVDFSREMVLAAGMGPRGGGNSIEIVAIRRSGRALEVAVRETTPRPGAIVNQIGAWPTHAVVVPRTPAPVRWVDSAEGESAASAGQTALPGALVEIFPAGPGRAADRQAVKAVRTDAQGRFSFGVMRPLAYVIRVTAEGYRTVRQEVRGTRGALLIRMTKVTQIARIEDIRPTPDVIEGDDVAVSSGGSTPSAPGTGVTSPATPGPDRTTLLGLSMR